MEVSYLPEVVSRPELPKNTRPVRCAPRPHQPTVTHISQACNLRFLPLSVVQYNVGDQSVLDTHVVLLKEKSEVMFATHITPHTSLLLSKSKHDDALEPMSPAFFLTNEDSLDPILFQFRFNCVVDAERCDCGIYMPRHHFLDAGFSKSINEYASIFMKRCAGFSKSIIPFVQTAFRLTGQYIDQRFAKLEYDVPFGPWFRKNKQDVNYYSFQRHIYYLSSG
jgi:hypothetical protein